MTQANSDRDLAEELLSTLSFPPTQRELLLQAVMIGLHAGRKAGRGEYETLKTLLNTNGMALEAARDRIKELLTQHPAAASNDAKVPLHIAKQIKALRTIGLTFAELADMFRLPVGLVRQINAEKLPKDDDE